jgi:GAF domain-containing protein
MIVKDKVIGALTIDHSERGFYLPEHVGLGMAFANQAAIEYENARLYSETIKGQMN